MRFKPGQKVVCVAKNKVWRGTVVNSPYGPKFNEIVTVKRYGTIYTDEVVLLEYEFEPGHDITNTYPEFYFEPLMDISELTEVLESETVKA